MLQRSRRIRSCDAFQPRPSFCGSLSCRGTPTHTRAGVSLSSPTAQSISLTFPPTQSGALHLITISTSRRATNIRTRSWRRKMEGAYGTHEHTPDRPGEVWRMSPDGDVSVVFVASNVFDMSLHPFLIATDGTVYSTNVYAGPSGPHRLLRRSPSGSMSVAISEAHGIDGLAFGPDGSIYFTDRTALRRLSPNGTVSTVAERLTTSSWGEDLMGLVVESATSIYVADYSSNRVLHVNGAGRQTAVFNSRWPWSPTGVARQGSSLLVLEHLRMPFVLLGNVGLGPYIRVLRIAADGTTETRVVVWGRYSWMAVVTFALGAVIARFLTRRRRSRSEHRTPSTG